MNVANLTPIWRVAGNGLTTTQLQTDWLRWRRPESQAVGFSLCFLSSGTVRPGGIISQLQAHVPHTQAGNPFSHLSATRSLRDSLFNQAQWAVESLKRPLFLNSLLPFQRTHIGTHKTTLCHGQLPVTHGPRPRNAPLQTCPTCYLYYDHSQLLAHCHKFSQVFAVRPIIRKSESGKAKKRFPWPCARNVCCCFFFFFGLFALVSAAVSRGSL